MRRPLPLLMLACLGLVAADAAWAQQGSRRSPPPFQQQPRQEMPSPPSAPRPEFPRPSRRDDDASSLSDSVRRIQRANGGRVLGAERVQSDGQEFTRIKIMDEQGRVRYVDDDRQPRRGVDRRRQPPSRDADATTP